MDLPLQMNKASPKYFELLCFINNDRTVQSVTVSLTINFNQIGIESLTTMNA